MSANNIHFNKFSNVVKSDELFYTIIGSTSTTYTFITNATVTITGTGRPGRIYLERSGTEVESGIGGTATTDIRLLKNGTPVQYARSLVGSSKDLSFEIDYIDTSISGSCTYTLEYKASTGSANFTAAYIKLVVIEYV